MLRLATMALDFIMSLLGAVLWDTSSHPLPAPSLQPDRLLVASASPPLPTGLPPSVAALMGWLSTVPSMEDGSTCPVLQTGDELCLRLAHHVPIEGVVGISPCLHCYLEHCSGGSSI